ncbi:MAG TPA: thioredoxin domain-containing protein, partial [Bauldia sp.]|nr:thioredoxin domain-containing protein [Bauldia sp.]
MSENLLRLEASPYLLQHKDNPVHWRPWGPAALAEARAANKPILLSVGYAACHWCHVMAHESFEDQATADVMNRLFVSIKVDREERPDIDQIYMTALHALGEQGGWPLTMFLTPDGEPIWGGTYFPPSARYGRPGFRDIMEEVARLFREEPAKIAQNRDFLLTQLKQPPAPGDMPVDRALLDQGSERLLGLMDTEHGGTRGAPKFPQASLLELLWRAGLRTRDRRYHDTVLLTLREISAGGIYDHIGGGFARYSTDARWLVPHFEKMLYDNAMLARSYVDAFAATRDERFKDVADGIFTWALREMQDPAGGFFSALDADSEGVEGKFYVWTPSETAAVLGAKRAELFDHAYDITAAGNWEHGRSIPRLTLSRANPRDYAEDRAKLYEVRRKRVWPGLDDKVLTSWNGLMIGALARGFEVLGQGPLAAGAADVARGARLREAAERAASFFLEKMRGPDGRLLRSYRRGEAGLMAYLEDYAFLA